MISGLPKNNIDFALFRTAQIMICLLILTNCVSAIESQSMQITPSARITWTELIRLDSTISRDDELEPVQIPAMTAPAGGEIGSVDLPYGFVQPPESIASPTADALVIALEASFDALTDNGDVIPPDTHGAVGLNHVMTMLNSQVRIQDRTGGIISTVRLATFWSPTGASGMFDPQLIYDQMTHRWMATCDANRQSAASSVLFAISDSDDATGGWTFYRIDADPDNVVWSDFPDLGFNKTWVAISNNMYTIDGSDWGGSALWVIDKASALSGGTLTLTNFSAGSDDFEGMGGFSLRVCRTFGNESKLYIVDGSGYTSGGTQLLRITELVGSGPSPVWLPTSGSLLPGTGAFPVPINYSYDQIDAAQKETVKRIDTNNGRLQSAVFRNGRIFCAHSGGLPVASVDRTAVFWYELNPTAFPNPIVQSGVLDGGNDVHHYYPSISANKNNDVMLGFTRSDVTRYAEAVFSFRFGSDPLGSIDPIQVMKLGENRYEKDFASTRIRWGDYSATVVDPTDDLCLWTIQEYADKNLSNLPPDHRWGTWWGQVCPPDIDADGDGFFDTEDNCPSVYNPAQTDSDNDGFGSACDCSDGNPLINPDATEICDGVDNDCDELIDGRDFDNDGSGEACDCDDNNPTRYPGADEICNGLDDNCDLIIDGPDQDVDGYASSCDCNDNNPLINPGATEICDGIDNNCDDLIDGPDADSDAFPAACDCDDTNPTINEGSTEICDGLDNDCDQVIDGPDNDNDGTPAACDCDDNNPDVQIGLHWYSDQDGDGFGDPNNNLHVCEPLPGYVLDNTDNCPEVYNPDQEDLNQDGVGDICCCGAFTGGFTGNIDCLPDGKRNLADITRLIDRVYISRAVLCCEASGNVDGDIEGKINLADITRLIDHVYISHTEAAACE